MFSFLCGNTTGLLGHPEWTIPLALDEGDPILIVQAIATVLDKSYLQPLTEKKTTMNFLSPKDSTLRADAAGGLMVGPLHCHFRVTTRSDQVGLAEWLICAQPGARYGLASAQVHLSELKTWELMIHKVTGDFTCAFIDFETRKQMASAYIEKSNELIAKFASIDLLISHLLDLAAKDAEFGGHSQVYGMPFAFMLYYLLCVLHIDNNECKKFTLALLDASVRRFQNRKGIKIDRKLDYIDYDSLDMYFHGNDVDSIDQNSSLRK